MENRTPAYITGGFDPRRVPSEGAFYLYDLAELHRRADALRRRLPPEVSLCYAVKANPFLIPAASALTERVELCSPGEAALCDRLSVPKEKTVISGVYKTPSVMERMVSEDAKDAGLRPSRLYTVESPGQYRLFGALARKYPAVSPLPLLLRLTNGSQFGLDREDITAILRDPDPFLSVRGIQYFSGTQKTSLKKIARELRMLDGFLLSLRDDLGFTPEELEYGPGFPVAYFPDDGAAFDEAAYLDGFRDLLLSLECRPMLKKLTLELGRSLVASCGHYAVHIVDQKTAAGQNYLITDGGMHQLTYYGGSMAMRTPPVTLPGKEDLPPDKSWNVCGALCSMNDILCKDLPLPPVELGDLLCFHLAGAYSVTEGMALFLTRDLPAVYLLKEDGSLVCARPRTETVPLNLANPAEDHEIL